MSIAIPVWIDIYCQSVGAIAELEAFCNANKANYELVIDKTNEAVIRLESEPGLNISVENLKQSTNLSERIKELRDECKEYNINLSKLRKYNSHWLLFLMFANPREELKLVRME